MQIDYLVGGLRISLGPQSRTPGPANHIENSTRALRELGHEVSLYLSSGQPVLDRFATVGEGAATGSRTPAVLGDAVRIGASLLNSNRVGASLLNSNRVGAWSAGSTADVVYERAAVLTDLSRSHRRVRSGAAMLVVESNGIFSRETAHDRDALASERLARRIERRLYRRADLVVAVSDNLAAEIVEYARVRDDRILVVPNGIPPEIVGWDRRGRRKVIGFAGAVVDWQNLDSLITAFARVHRAGPEYAGWRIHVVGDGPALPALRRTVAACGLERAVRFLPRMPRTDLYDEMASWSVGVALHTPSSSRTMYHSPLKLYEYAGMGVACLAGPSSDAVGLGGSGAAITVVEPTVDGIAAALPAAMRAGDVDPEVARRRGTAVLPDHSWTSRMDAVVRRIDEQVQARNRSATERVG